MVEDTVTLSVWSLACGAPLPRTRCQLCEAPKRGEVLVSSPVGYGTLSHVSQIGLALVPALSLLILIGGCSINPTSSHVPAVVAWFTGGKKYTFQPSLAAASSITFSSFAAEFRVSGREPLRQRKGWHLLGLWRSPRKIVALRHRRRWYAARPIYSGAATVKCERLCDEY